MIIKLKAIRKKLFVIPSRIDISQNKSLDTPDKQLSFYGKETRYNFNKRAFTSCDI